MAPRYRVNIHSSGSAEVDAPGRRSWASADFWGREDFAVRGLADLVISAHRETKQALEALERWLEKSPAQYAPKLAARVRRALTR